VNLIDPQSRPVLAPGVRRQNDRKTGEPILVFPEGAMFLNGTASDIVNLCNGKLTVDELISQLAGDYDLSKETLAGDVLDSLLELDRRKLVRFLK
jgi:pyrroloquinoline quinone biosynthesis protein D